MPTMMRYAADGHGAEMAPEVLHDDWLVGSAGGANTQQ
jgi:hypothetical protein